MSIRDRINTMMSWISPYGTQQIIDDSQQPGRITSALYDEVDGNIGNSRGEIDLCNLSFRMDDARYPVVFFCPSLIAGSRIATYGHKMNYTRIDDVITHGIYGLITEPMNNINITRLGFMVVKNRLHLFFQPGISKLIRA